MKSKKIISLLLISILVLGVALTGCSAAKTAATTTAAATVETTTEAVTEAPVLYPEKPVKIIVCRSAGGSTDMVARTFQPYLQKYLGTNVVVENIDGAAGRIGLTAAFKADPDGYSLVFGNFPSYVLTEHIAGGVDYKISDFVPIYNVNGGESAAIVVPFDSPYNTIEDLVAAAKASPGMINAALPSGLSNSSLGFGIM